MFYSEWLADQARDTPGHPFRTVPLLNNPVLLSRLKMLVTTEADGQILRATGIPPTVQNAVTLDTMLGLCRDTLERVENIQGKVGEAAVKALENNAIKNGQMTKQQVTNLIFEGQADTRSFAGEAIKELKSSVTTAIARHNLAPRDTGNVTDNGDAVNDDNGHDIFADGEEDNAVKQSGQGSGFRTFAHGRRLWDTPPNFKFPSDLHAFGSGWTLWIVGLPGHAMKASDGSTQAAPIRPFRSLNPKLLPNKLRTQHVVNWRPIFKLMEEAPNLNIPEDPSAVNAAVIRETLQKAKAHLKT
jgi:hypothetical protein